MTKLTGATMGNQCRVETKDPGVLAYLKSLPKRGGYADATASKQPDGTWLVSAEAAKYLHSLTCSTAAWAP